MIHMANQCTKFEVSNLSHSRDIVVRSGGWAKILNGSRDVTTPFQEQLVFAVDCDLLWPICTTNLKSLV